MLALYIIAGIILFITFVLSIPVDMAFDFKIHEQVTARVRVGWFFGLVWKDIRGRKKEPERKPQKRRKWNVKPFLSTLKIKGLPGKLLKLAKRLLGCLNIRELDANLRIGLDNPGDTGILYSILWPALIPLGSSDSIRFRTEPVFDAPTLEVSLHGRLRLFPVKVIGVILRFVLSPAGWRTLRSMVVSRWK